MISEIVKAVQETAYSLSVNPSSAEEDLRILKDALVTYFVVQDIGAILVTNDFQRRVYPDNGTDFTLEEAQGFVDGNIEIVALNDGSDYILVINEEGKFTKEPNLPATAIARRAQCIDSRDYICGDVILCHTSMIR